MGELPNLVYVLIIFVFDNLLYIQENSIVEKDLFLDWSENTDEVLPASSILIANTSCLKMMEIWAKPGILIKS